MNTSGKAVPGFALHLVVDDVERSIAWYEAALGARVTRVLRLPDGAIATVDLDVRGLPVAMAAPVPGTPLASPSTSGTSAAAYRLGVEDADEAMKQARAAGATVSEEVHDAFWGIRTGEVLDPSGHRWAFDQHVRDVTVEEIESRLAELLSGPH
ncbi:VOC family protein [Streptomyces sp. SID8379]|uniref:VOC family protein n=1 Tax=unclassified Streptomyces TaxID=2593676 RepID=UPI00037C2406|nr:MULTISPECIES: VOC family protein [unclassified Streptomyces]MYW70153.1 VOC family protein [Streptomyces sp. SID8379]